MARTLNINLFLLTIATLISFVTSTSFATEQISGSVFVYDAEPLTAVVVDKKSQTLYIVQTKDDMPEVVAKTSVLVGGGEGDKRISGDLKTPEGVYFITGYISPESLRRSYGNVADDYGSGAFPLNYPNVFDKISGKTGSGIWIHGKRVDREEQNTRGCVALENDVLDQYKHYLKKGTPVVITNNVGDQLNDYAFEKLFLKEKLNTLLKAWEGSDFEEFASHYHLKFKNENGEAYAEYLRKKKKLMKLFPERKIDIFSLTAFKENDDEFVYDFDQLYCASNILTFGNKKLYLKKEVDDLKVVAEEFTVKPITPVIQDRIEAFLSNWGKSWEARNIDEYMSNYSNNFSSTGFNFDSWKKDKEEKFEKYSEIEVNIDNIKISQITPQKVRVSFNQRFKGDSYSDRGVKTLELEGCPGDYKIIGELWRAK